MTTFARALYKAPIVERKTTGLSQPGPMQGQYYVKEHQQLSDVLQNKSEQYIPAAMLHNPNGWQPFKAPQGYKSLQAVSSYMNPQEASFLEHLVQEETIKIDPSANSSLSWRYGNQAHGMHVHQDTQSMIRLNKYNPSQVKGGLLALVDITQAFSRLLGGPNSSSSKIIPLIKQDPDRYSRYITPTSAPKSIIWNNTNDGVAHFVTPVIHHNGNRKVIIPDENTLRELANKGAIKNLVREFLALGSLSKITKYF